MNQSHNSLLHSCKVCDCVDNAASRKKTDLLQAGDRGGFFIKFKPDIGKVYSLFFFVFK